MATRYVFGELLLFTFFLVLLRPIHIKETPCCKINASIQQLWNFTLEKLYQSFNTMLVIRRMRHNKLNSSTTLNWKLAATLIRQLKIVLLAELNISVCLQLCGDIECNPGPSCTDCNTFELPAKGFTLWSLEYKLFKHNKARRNKTAHSLPKW